MQVHWIFITRQHVQVHKLWEEFQVKYKYWQDRYLAICRKYGFSKILIQQNPTPIICNCKIGIVHVAIKADHVDIDNLSSQH